MKAEILAPAGDEQSAYTALLAGADALYLGLTQFSARQSAENFDVSALARTAEFAHLLDAKIYVCLNTLVKDDETDDFFSHAVAAWNAGADALLIQDLFLGKRLKELYPEIVLHLSTQAGCCNVYGARLAKEFGFSRVVLARETPIEEIAKISQIVETEVFVQGALCTAFSGQCYLSSFAGNNSGNRGRCKQPCRKKYTVDRAGCTENAYALSTSDLCVGERVKELTAAGVASLKIEGRLRRREYAAAAVRYYRALLNGENTARALSLLKRAYNRGDYTAGLAFGQKKDFLSRKVQGHIGEDVGELTFVNGTPFCRSNFPARKGDCFKILRGGEEAGSAVFSAEGRGGFFLSVSGKGKAGDRVRVTTDTAGNLELLTPQKRRQITVELRFVAGEKPLAKCGEFVFTGAEPLASAKNAPLSEEELAACFCKTDGALAPEITVTMENAFLQKSALNAFRREFYPALVRYLAPARKPLEKREIPKVSLTPASEKKTAVISERRETADVFIYAPADYEKLTVFGGEVYLYLPPFLTSEEIERLRPVLFKYGGIYCDGYYALALAKEEGKKLFAGTGFNLTNRYAVEEVQRRAEYFALSKELSAREQERLAVKGAFAQLSGSVKVMDILYCPFEKTCKSCDKREFYTLTDEDGREFPLRRYTVFGACRFELYNCAPLASAGEISALTVQTASGQLRGKTATHGHEKGSMK